MGWAVLGWGGLVDVGVDVATGVAAGVVGLELGGRHAAQVVEQSAVVEPVDPL